MPHTFLSTIPFCVQKGDDVCLVHALCAIVHLLSRCRPTFAAKHLTPFVGSRMRLRPRHTGGEGEGEGHRHREEQQPGDDSGRYREGNAASGGLHARVGEDESGSGAEGGGEDQDSEEAVVWVHRQLLLLLRRCLSRAAELRLPRLVVATRLILARFSIEVQRCGRRDLWGPVGWK